MSCCGGCGGTISQIVRTTGVCCPSIAGDTATIVDADGNTLDLTNFDTNDITVALTLAGNVLTVDVSGQTAMVDLPEDVLTSLTRTNGALAFQDEEGNATNIDLSDLVNIPETLTNLVFDAGNSTLTYTGEDGTPQILDLSGLADETLTTLQLQGDTLNYTDETGGLQAIDLSVFRETESSIAFDPNTSTLTYTPESGVAIPIDLSVLENLTTLAFDPATSRLTYTAENGVATIADLSGLNVLTSLAFDAASSTLTYLAEDGGATNIDLSGFNETVTTLIFNPGNSTLTYTNEAGAAANIDLTSLIPVAAANSPTVNLAGDGTAATPLTATANISAQANNALQAVADGLFVLQQGVSAIAFNAATGILTFTDQVGANTDLDLSGLMVASTTANSPTVNLAGDGTVANPLTATANISAQAGNIIQAVADGLFAVETVTALAFNAGTGILSFTDEAGAATDLDLSGLMAASTTQNSPTVTLAGDGTAVNPLQADAVISAQAGNTLQAVADGLFVSATMTNAALELAGTDLNLRVDGNIVSTVDLRNAATVIINDALGNPIGRALPL